MTLDDFIKKYDGKGIDFDGKFSTQCVDLYRQYVKEVLSFPQSPPVEGAKDIWDTYLPEYYKRIENTPYGVPEKGDIVIWGTKIGKYGHVAIFLEGDAKKFKSFDQNFPVRTLCHIQEHTYTGVLGWLRPIVKSMQIPDWFKTLLQERGLSLDREGEFRAFWEKAIKYDDDIRQLQEQIKTANEALSQKTLEISMQMDKIQQLQNKVDELNELYNKTKQERDDFEWQARNALSSLENLQEQLQKQEVELQGAKEEIKRLKDDNVAVLDKIPPLKLILEGFVHIFTRR